MKEKHKFYGVCYRLNFPDGCFYIGSTKHWNDNYYGSGGERLKEHKRIYDISRIERVVIRDDFKNEEEMRAFEDDLINSYFRIENGVKKRTKEGSKLLNAYSGNISKTFTSRMNIVCSECGGLCGHHKLNCKNFSRKTKQKGCSECGSLGFHKKSCSKYISTICDECGKDNYCHHEWCSKYVRKDVNLTRNKCSECGSLPHKKTCSMYKNTIRSKCEECGAIGVHFGWCSKTKAKNTCKDCGGLNGRHRKGCSKYKLIICKECGGENNNHKASCSKCVICKECKGVNGHHRKQCSKYRYNKKRSN